MHVHNKKLMCGLMLGSLNAYHFNYFFSSLLNQPQKNHVQFLDADALLSFLSLNNLEVIHKLLLCSFIT